MGTPTGMPVATTNGHAVGFGIGESAGVLPGDQRTFTMSNLDQPRMEGGGAEFRVWGGMGFGNPESVADIGLWQAVLSAGGANFRSPDAVVAAGWTRDYQPEVRVGRRVARPPARGAARAAV